MVYSVNNNPKVAGNRKLMTILELKVLGYTFFVTQLSFIWSG